jgi:hypothetical protein
MFPFPRQCQLWEKVLRSKAEDLKIRCPKDAVSRMRIGKD